MKKVLFILKRREVKDPVMGVYSHGGLSSGLLNSARMVAEMLETFGLHDETGKVIGCDSKLVQVIDNNDIDREVAKYKPDIVIIEAFWVVPEKFAVLEALHPKVKWLIRNHSNVPFLAQEGQIVTWISEYVKYKNVYVATNTKESLGDIQDILISKSPDADTQKKWLDKVVYFPNFYIDETVDEEWEFNGDKDSLDIGCFGAVRVLKNHVQQACAALRFARKHGKFLNFHINAGRVEGVGSDPVIKNLRAVFANSVHAKLIEHPWMPHDEFVKVISKMDLSIQVSFSETFNIVTADAVSMGVPVVVSSDVKWINSRYQADPTNSDDIVAKMQIAYDDSREGLHAMNNDGLAEYNNRSIKAIGSTILNVINHIDVV